MLQLVNDDILVVNLFIEFNYHILQLLNLLRRKIRRPIIALDSQLIHDQVHHSFFVLFGSPLHLLDVNFTDMQMEFLCIVLSLSGLARRDFLNINILFHTLS